MSYYQPRVYSTTKHLEKMGAEPVARYSDVSKKDYLPNEGEVGANYNVDLESSPYKTKIFIALLLTLSMT